MERSKKREGGDECSLTLLLPKRSGRFGALRLPSLRSMAVAVAAAVADGTTT